MRIEKVQKYSQKRPFLRECAVLKYPLLDAKPLIRIMRSTLPAAGFLVSLRIGRGFVQTRKRGS